MKRLIRQIKYWLGLRPARDKLKQYLEHSEDGRVVDFMWSFRYDACWYGYNECTSDHIDISDYNVRVW